MIDAAHDARPIVEAVGTRRCIAIAATHGHNDHINVAGELSDELGVPIWIHPDDLVLWAVVYPSPVPDELLVDGQWLSAGSAMLQVFHTPGHSPGGCCFYDADEGVLFSGIPCSKAAPGPRAQLLRFPDDRRVEHRDSPVGLAGRDQGPPRSRSDDHDRRRGTASS